MARFRDVTILHGHDGAQWCEYLLKPIEKNCDIVIHSVDVDELAYKDPPEIETSVRESYVLILLVTSGFLDYMEDNTNWFDRMLEKRDPLITTVFVATVCVDTEDLMGVCENYHPSSWEFVEIAVDGSNKNEVITIILERAEINIGNHKKGLDSEDQGLSIPNQSAVCELFPSKIRMNDDEIAVVFHDEIEGEVTLVFDEINEAVTTVRMNPFCVSFTPPALSQGIHKVHILLDGYEKEVLSIEYYNAEFTSVEFMRQFFDVPTIDDLDKVLSEKYRDSVCTDDILKRLITLAAAQKQITSLSSEKNAGSCYPTALHWAAAHGLSELTCQLLMSPLALDICQIKNRHGDTVSDLAQHGGHVDLRNYIEDFIETQQCADVCDLYVQASNIAVKSAQEPRDGYIAMSSKKLENVPEDFYEDLALEPIDPKGVPPPLPSRDRIYSVPETTFELQKASKNFPNHREFLQMKTEPQLSEGAMGCRSQNELIDIMTEVKEGNFTIDDAVRLFNSWTDRNHPGKFATSFKDKQRTLNDIREKYKRTLSVLTMARQKKILSSKISFEHLDCIQISEPCVIRKGSVGPMHRRIEQRSSDTSSRASNNSTSMRSSCDSGCDFSDGSRDSTDVQQISDHPTSLAGQYRQSVDTLSNESTCGPPPPIPPRPPPQKKKAVLYDKRKNRDSH